MILKLKKVYIIQRDDADNSGDDTVVELIAINDGVEGSSVFGISSERREMSVDGGEIYVNSASPSMDIRVLRPTGNAYTGKANVDQLKEWSQNAESVYVVGLTVGGGIVYFGSQFNLLTAKITANESLSTDSVFACKVTLNSTLGFSTSSGIYEGGFWAGENLFGIYEWGDADDDGVANGFVSISFSSESFSSGQQELISGTGTCDFVRSTYLPVAGETLTFSFSVDTYPTGADVSLLQIQCADKSDLVLDDNTFTFSSTGRASVAITAPAGTVRVICRIQQSATVGTVTGRYSDPMLSLTGSTVYTKF